MSEPVKDMASLCFIHDVQFRNLAEEREFSVGEDLSYNVDFF